MYKYVLHDMYYIYVWYTYIWNTYKYLPFTLIISSCFVLSLPVSLLGRSYFLQGKPVSWAVLHPQHLTQSLAQCRCITSPVSSVMAYWLPGHFRDKWRWPWPRVVTLHSLPKWGGNLDGMCLYWWGGKKLDFILFADRDVQESLELCWGLLSISF